MPDGTVKDVTVDITYKYDNIESATPMATGQIGTATLSGQPAPTLATPGRCSRPREGCGPNANGDAPCTVWPRCPGT